ncbi:MAG TPA: helix-turn-helix transcriptional regulator [Verrucomicrobiae bacterium]|nr:helix-turn-helix transcriptional regulator [Verrucomicrobiae bacterium]
MANHNLPNYLRTCRKSTGFSQEEIAYLLGFHSAHVSRFERFRRTPGFRTALAFEVIFKLSLRELFSGEYKSIESAIRRRAKRLVKRLAAEQPGNVTDRKLAHLKKIIGAAQ